MSRKLSILLILIVIAIGVLVTFQLIRPQPTSEGESVTDANSASPAEGQPQDEDEHEAMLAYSRCMQDNGLPEFPNPTANGINLNGTGIDRESPEFKAAEEACESVRPQAPDSSQNERIVPGDSEWEKVVPGGDTKCADGSEFAF